LYNLALRPPDLGLKSFIQTNTKQTVYLDLKDQDLKEAPNSTAFQRNQLNLFIKSDSFGPQTLCFDQSEFVYIR
jgi:hypothetical protein